MAGNQYFTPDPSEFGTQQFQQSGEAEGWYQFIRTGFTGDTINISVTEGATGFMLEARTTVRYSLSPNANVPGSPYLELAAGQTIFLSGRASINQFSVWLPDGGDTDFIITFYQGNIGPIPALFRQGGAPPGPPPPPPPGSANIPTQNVLHVMQNGNDATGTRNRMDLPFLTVAAAEAAALPNDTIVVWQGGYLANGLGSKRLSWLLLEGSALTCTSGILFDAAEDLVIGGSGRLQVSGGETTINIASGRTVKINGVDIVSSGEGIRLNGGRVQGVTTMACQGPCIITNEEISTVELTGNMSSDADSCIVDVVGLNGWVRGNVNSNADIGISHHSGGFTVHGDVSAASYAIFSTQDSVLNIYGDVFSGIDESAIMNNNAGIINVYGNIRNDDGGAVFNNGVGTVSLYGNCVTNGTAIIVADGRVDVQGNIDNGANQAAVNTSAQFNMTGSISSGGVGILCQAGCVVRHTGDINSTGAAITGEGSIFMRGNATVSGGIVNAMLLTGGSLQTEGNITSASTGTSVRINSGTYTHHGNITNTAGPALWTTGVNSLATVYGDVTGADAGYAWQCANGRITVYGRTVNTAGPAGRVTGGTVNVVGNIESTTNIGLLVIGGTTVTVRGDVIGTQGLVTQTTSSATQVRLYGRSVGTAGEGVSFQNAANMQLHLFGEVVGSTSGATTGVGTINFYGPVTSSGANQSALTIVSNTGVVNCYAGSRFIATGTGTSIFSATNPTVRSYQASGNTLPSGTITVVGTYNVIV